MIQMKQRLIDLCIIDNESIYIELHNDKNIIHLLLENYIARKEEKNIKSKKKSNHLIALQLTNTGRIIIMKTKEPYNTSKANEKQGSIYLPKNLNQFQTKYLKEITNIINTFDTITIYNEIEEKNNVYLYQAITTNAKEKDIIYTFLQNNSYQKKKIKKP